MNYDLLILLLAAVLGLAIGLLLGPRVWPYRSNSQHAGATEWDFCIDGDYYLLFPSGGGLALYKLDKRNRVWLEFQPLPPRRVDMLYTQLTVLRSGGRVDILGDLREYRENNGGNHAS